MKRGSDGQLRLSPKAMRQLGKALLRDVAQRMSGRQGQRDLRQAGAAGEPSGATREWAFGDTEPWDVTRTVTNAVVRTAAEGRRRPRRRRRLDIQDVEVIETEAAHPGRGGAAGRHVVLDGDGRPLGADEAHRARPAPR